MSTTIAPTPRIAAWQTLTVEPWEKTDRLVIEGGYLYRTTIWTQSASGNRTASTSMVLKLHGPIGSQSAFETPVAEPNISPTSISPSI